MEVGSLERFLEGEVVGGTEDHDVRCLAVADALVVDGKDDVHLCLLEAADGGGEGVFAIGKVHGDDGLLVVAIDDMVFQLIGIDISAVLSLLGCVPCEMCPAVGGFAEDDVLRQSGDVLSDEYRGGGFDAVAGLVGGEHGVGVGTEVAGGVVVGEDGACRHILERLEDDGSTAEGHLVDGLKGCPAHGGGGCGEGYMHRALSLAAGCKLQVTDGCGGIHRCSHLEVDFVEIELEHLGVAARLEAEVPYAGLVQAEELLVFAAVDGVDEGDGEDFAVEGFDGAVLTHCHADFLGPSGTCGTGLEAEAVEVVGGEGDGRRDEPVVHGVFRTVVTDRRTGVLEFPGDTVVVGIDDGEEFEVRGMVERFGIGHGERLADEELVAGDGSALEVSGIGDDLVPECREGKRGRRVGIGGGGQTVFEHGTAGIADDLIIEGVGVEISLVESLLGSLPREADALAVDFGLQILRSLRGIVSGPEPHLFGRTVSDFVANIDAHFHLTDGHVAESFPHLCPREGSIHGHLHIVEGNDIVELTLQGLAAEGGGRHREDNVKVGSRRRVVGHGQVGGGRRGIVLGTLSGDVEAAELLTAGELALQRGGSRGDIHLVEGVEGFGAGRPIEFAGSGVEGGGLRIAWLDAGVADDRLAAVLLVDEEQTSGAVDTVHLAGGVGCHGKERTAEVADGTDATVLGAKDAEEIAVEVVVEEASVDLAAHGIVGEVGGDARQLHTVGAQAAPVFGIVDIVIGKDASHAGIEEIDETVFVVDEDTSGIGIE